MGGDFSTIEAAIAAIGRGEVVIVVDAEDRENEGDFICAAEKVTPEIVNFMITNGRGQLCMPILPEVSERLKLAPMVEANTSFLGTSFTVPVDHNSSKTGITAQERARTIQAIVDPTSKPADFVRPGHLFPLGGQGRGRAAARRAHRGHRRSGAHGRPGAGRRAVRNSRPQRRPRQPRRCSSSWPGKHELEIISIEELIRYRRVREKLVYRIAEARLPTRYGLFKIIFYGVKYEAQQPFVLVMGEPDKAADAAGAAALVLLHRRRARLAALRLRRPTATWPWK